MQTPKCPAIFAQTRADGPSLQHAGTYRRRVYASSDRIWENVFDWEHLAHLHDGSFAACNLVDRGPWGWCVDLTPQGGKRQRIELRVDRASGTYVSTTIDGTGAGSEIRVTLDPIAAHIFDVTVEFHLPGPRTGRTAELGQAYAAIYAKLWDEDEAMMQARERALGNPTAPDRDVPSVVLGDERSVRSRLPLPFVIGGMTFHLVEHEGNLIAHTILCPHWLGPLVDMPINGKVRCPWHGYVFDIQTRRCEGQPTLKLATPPLIRITDGQVSAAFA